MNAIFLFSILAKVLKSFGNLMLNFQCDSSAAKDQFKVITVNLEIVFSNKVYSGFALS